MQSLKPTRRELVTALAFVLGFLAAGYVGANFQDLNDRVVHGYRDATAADVAHGATGKVTALDGTRMLLDAGTTKLRFPLPVLLASFRHGTKDYAVLERAFSSGTTVTLAKSGDGVEIVVDK